MPKRDTRVYMGRKAAKVAQTKNKNDAIRTKLYGKFGKEIARAAKEGGTGTDNVRLQAILKDAKRMSVPAQITDGFWILYFLHISRIIDVVTYRFH